MTSNLLLATSTYQDISSCTKLVKACINVFTPKTLVLRLIKEKYKSQESSCQYLFSNSYINVNIIVYIVSVDRNLSADRQLNDVRLKATEKYKINFCAAPRL